MEELKIHYQKDILKLTDLYQVSYAIALSNLPRNYLNDFRFGADEKEFHFTSQMQREELLRACFPGFPHNIWIQGFWIIIMKDFKELII